MAMKQKKPYDIKGRKKKTFVVANRSDKGKKRPTYKQRESSLIWDVRKAKEERKAYLEAVDYCETNIKKIYTSNRYNHISEKSKDFIATSMLKTHDYIKAKYEEKYKNDLIKYNKKLDRIKKKVKK